MPPRRRAPAAFELDTPPARIPSSPLPSSPLSSTTSSPPPDAPQSPDPTLYGYKEIGTLASWTVSTAKPGNSIPQLRSEDTTEFWQSDGPQPHYLHIHFARRVKIAKMRMYLDFENDESYTPTKMLIHAGTGYHDLVQLASLELERPCGWVDIPLGEGEEEGRELRTRLVRLTVVANHQNGKDTHVRGFEVYARDEGREKAVGEVGFTNQRMLEELELR